MQQDAALTERLSHVIMRAGGPSAVARLLGVTPPAVSAWLRGSVPYTHHQIQLAEKLGISERWLRHGEGHEEGEDNEPQSSRVKEPSTRQNSTADLARSLAQKIIDFETTPVSFERIALAEIKQDVEEFLRRAQRRIEIHNAKPVRYSARNNHKK